MRNLKRGVLCVQITTVPQTLYRLFPGLIQVLRNNDIETIGICAEGTWLRKSTAEEKLGIKIYSAGLKRTVSPISDLKALIAVTRIMFKENPQIVHSHTPKGGLIGGLASVVTRRKFRVYTIRGLPHLTAQGFLKRVLIFCERVSCRCAHQVFCVSQSVKDEVVHRSICCEAKIRVPCAVGSAQGVDSIRFDPGRKDLVEKSWLLRKKMGIAKSSVVVGFVGRLTQDKGTSDLVEVWKLIRERQNVRLVVIGADNEPRSGNVRGEIEALRQDEKVRVVGVSDFIEPYYSMFDVLLFPSRREGMPNAVLEASAMHVPVVGWDVMGSRDAIVNEKTGFTVPLGNIDEMTKAVLQLIECPELRRQYGSLGRERIVRDFQPEERYLELARLYRSKVIGESANDV